MVRLVEKTKRLTCHRQALGQHCNRGKRFELKPCQSQMFVKRKLVPGLSGLRFDEKKGRGRGSGGVLLATPTRMLAND